MLSKCVENKKMILCNDRVSLAVGSNFLVGIRSSRKIKVALCLVKIQSFVVKTGVTSPGRTTGRWYLEAVRCPDYMPPPPL